jgi:hypothetical protein
VEPVGLVGFVWEQSRGGQMRWGIAYRAGSFRSVAEQAAA